MSSTIIDIENLSKTYKGGLQALKNVNLKVQEGEIIALLGPNGAGKSTLISTICGISQPTRGKVRVGGFNILKDYRRARSLIGLVPQELTLEMFDTVLEAVRFSRGLHGKPRDDHKLEQILRDLSLWDKRHSQSRALSGGMKRRVLIAKALSHEPKVLFLDEPTAGVDIELRKSMWDVVKKLRAGGVTIILTTHYIEEAEAIADRIAVIGAGEISLVKPTSELLEQMGQHQVHVILDTPLANVPVSLERFDPICDGQTLTYRYHKGDGVEEMLDFVDAVRSTGLKVIDVQTKRSSLEDVFMDLIGQKQGDQP